MPFVRVLCGVLPGLFSKNRVGDIIRILALDIGTKRIGVAVSDPMGWTAQPVMVLERKDQQSDLQNLRELCERLEVTSLLLGLPVNMNGTFGPKADEITETGQWLESELGLPVVYQDERLTTVSAQRTLLEAGVSRRKRKKSIDKLAAVYILQAYLDKKSQV